jgi:uncharacterized membrane protein YoaK (UPF0700 family)
MTRGWHVTLGLILTALAGYVDALGFLSLGGFYTSFMSGNTTQLGVSLSYGHISAAALPMLLIGMFLVGATTASGLSILSPASWKTPVVLAYEAIVLIATLALGLAIPEAGLTSAFMALAMGSQNAVLSSVLGFRVGTTFVTGALFGVGQRLAAALTRTGPPLGWVGDATVWLALMTGALAGAFVYERVGMYALIAPAGLAGSLAAATSLFVTVRAASSSAAIIPRRSREIIEARGSKPQS